WVRLREPLVYVPVVAAYPDQFVLSAWWRMPPRAFGTAAADPTRWTGPPGLNPMVPADALPVVATARPASRVSMPRRMPHRRSIHAPCLSVAGPTNGRNRAHYESIFRFLSG